MNQKQRLILAIFIPIIIFFIALMIANNLGYTERTRILPEDSYLHKYLGKTTTTIHVRGGNPFDWENTWYVWLLCLILICIFEYKLFEDKKER